MSDKLKCFIIDDDPDIIELLSALLEGAGHEVSHDISSATGFEKVLAETPDCLLVDIMMPGKNGLEICKELRQRTSHDQMKIIVVSAWAAASIKSYEFDRKRAFELGADGFITKPVDTDSFVAEVERIVEDQIAVKFWGVHGTLPVPGEKTIRYGGNTSCVTMEFADGALFIFDAGSGIKELSNYLMASGRSKLEGNIFISHPHWDHINALPFFEPLYIPGNEFEILGPSRNDLSMREIISAQMEGVYFPITLEEFRASVNFRDLKEEIIKIGAVTVRTMPLSHPGYCLGYRVEYDGRSVCYVTDNELFFESEQTFNENYVKKLVEFVKGTDLLITDTTYTDEEYATKVGWGHSCISQVVDLADRGEVGKLCLFHHDPDQGDAEIDAKLRFAKSLLEDRNSTTECIAPAERDVCRI